MCVLFIYFYYFIFVKFFCLFYVCIIVLLHSRHNNNYKMWQKLILIALLCCPCTLSAPSSLMCMLPSMAPHCKDGQPITQSGSNVNQPPPQRFDGNPKGWQTPPDASNPEATGIGTGSDVDFGPILSNSGLPSSKIGGGSQGTFDRNGAQLGQNVDILGVAKANRGLGTNIDPASGNFGLSGGQGMNVGPVGLSDNAGVQAGKDGFGIGRQAGVDGIVSGGQSGGVDFSDPDKVHAGGGSNMDVMNGFLGMGRNTNADVDKRTGATNVGSHTGVGGMFDTGSNLGIDPMNGQFGGGGSTCVMGFCGTQSTGVGIGGLSKLFGRKRK